MQNYWNIIVLLASRKLLKHFRANMPSYEQIKINLSSSFCSWMYFWGYGALSKLELIFIGAIIGPVLPII